MALAYLNNGPKQKDRIIAVDLGSRTTKAVHIHRRGEAYALCGYTLMDAPIFEKTMSADLLAEHLKAINQTMDAKTRTVTLTVGVNDSIVRHAEMPRMPVDDLRQVLKLSSKTYLQQELHNYLYDCHILTGSSSAKSPESPKAAASGQAKQRILVAGAKKQFVDELVAGARTAGLSPEGVVPAMIGPANTFERVQPHAFANDVVALIDLGFKSSSICIMHQGELALSRVVTIGGDKLTSSLAEILGISYAEAEGIKVGMPTEVQTHLETLVMPLGRELRASIDFYEHQNDKAVSKAFITGGSARSEFIMQRLQQDLMIECEVLNPGSFLQLELNPQQTAEFEQVSPQLSVALGAALAGI